MADPYFYSLYRYATVLSLQFHQYNLRVRFILDDQGKLGEKCIALWDKLRSTNSKAKQVLLPPRFANDKATPPLQAADLFVWREQRIRRGLDTMNFVEATLRPLPAMQLDPFPDDFDWFATQLDR
jgi:hypothetical protein